MQPPPMKKPAGPRDYVGETLEGMKSGKAKYESVEDALLAAMDMLAEDERGERLLSHRRHMRGEPDADDGMTGSDAHGEPDGDEAMPKECMDGTCDHPEHQHEDSLPEEF